MIVRILLFIFATIVFLVVAFTLLRLLGNNRKRIDGRKNASDKHKMQDRVYR